jgi:hypothetical protein
MIQASQIGIPTDLSSVLGSISKKPKAAISSTWGDLLTQSGADARPGVSRRVGTGSYFGDRFATGENLAQEGLKTGLEGVLGDTSYTDWRNERENQRAMELARLSGGMMQPNSLEQALSALGSAARFGGQLYGMKGAFTRSAPQSEWTGAI